MGIEVGGIVGLIILVADVWAIIQVVGSAASTLAKVIWVVAILLLPILGFIAWLLFGPRSAAPIRS
ncbi:MAG: PLDc N-terminal domain-containing protein [Geminicoccaceae bacterium]